MWSLWENPDRYLSDYQKLELQKQSAFRACAFHLEKINAGITPLPLPADWADITPPEVSLRGRNALTEIDGPRLMASVLTDLQLQLSKLKIAHDPHVARMLLQDLRFLRVQDLDVFTYFMVEALPYFKRDDVMDDLFYPLTISMSIKDPRIPLVGKRLFELGGEEEIWDEAGTQILFFRKLMAVSDLDSLVPTERLQEVFDNSSFIHAQKAKAMTLEKAEAFYKSISSDAGAFGRPTSEETLEWARLWHEELAAEYAQLRNRLSARQKHKEKSRAKPN